MSSIPSSLGCATICRPTLVARLHYTRIVQSNIGPYRIECEIGRGGMGVVYRAQDDRLGREVAIKALPPEVAADPVRLERFEREAKSLASVSSQHIAGIYGVEEQDGQRFLILELVEGESLADRLDRGPIEPDEALELADQIAAGVEAAHEAGVVHRDLKPDNIQVTPDGIIKVLDFGLARSDEGQTSSGMGMSQMETQITLRQQTTPGAVLGTAAYMSPEQARGRRVDKRTDIWAFGVVLFEMLTGANPFSGETATDSIGAVLHKDPDLSSLPVSIPIGVRRVLSRCLERDRNLRYRDIGDVRIELRRAATEPAEEVTVTQRGLSPVLALVVALLLAVGGLAAGWLARPIEVPSEFRLSVAGPPNEVVFGPMLDPQGRYVVYGTYPLEGGAARVGHIRWLDRHDSVPIEVSRGGRWADISPDGDWLSFAAPLNENNSEFALMKQVASLELPPVQVCILPESNAISFYRHLWMSQGRFLLDDSRTNQVRWVDAESGSIGEPIVLDLGDYKGRYLGLHARVDDHLALVYLSGSSDQSKNSDIGLLDMETATVKLLVENTESARIGPDGSLLFTRGSTLYGAQLDLATRTVGPAKQLVAGLRVNANELDARFEVANDGTIAFLPGGVQGADRDIVFQSPDGELTSLGIESKPYLEHLAVSADESRLVVVVNSPSNRFEIWGTELDTPRMRRVRGVQGGDLNYPFLGPDNDTLVYARMINGKASVEVASFDGRFEPRLIIEPVEVGFIAPVAIHPSGDRVLVLWEKPEGFRNYEVKLDGTGTLKPVSDNDSNVAWSDYSPDGTMIAYTSDETGRREIYVRTINEDGSFGRSVPVTTRGARYPQWQLDPARRPGAPESEGDAAGDPDAPFMLIVFDRARIDIYPVTPGDMPRVGEPTVGVFPVNSDFIGGGASLSGNRQLRIVRGQQETPATHVELILNWYDKAVKIIKDE